MFFVLMKASIFLTFLGYRECQKPNRLRRLPSRRLPGPFLMNFLILSSFYVFQSKSRLAPRLALSLQQQSCHLNLDRIWVANNINNHWTKSLPKTTIMTTTKMFKPSGVEVWGLSGIPTLHHSCTTKDV